MRKIDVELIEETIAELQAKGYKQISLKPIRDRQDEALTNDLIEAALKKVNDHNSGIVNNNSFYVGSVDFMVNTSSKPSKLFVLETNGGSSRGFSILPQDKWLASYESFMQPIEDFKKAPVVVIGYPSGDLLKYEKLFLAQAIKEKILEKFCLELKIIDVEELAGTTDESVIVLDSYSNLLHLLSINENVVYILNHKVDLLIGDGIARRHSDISHQIIVEELETIVVNEIFHVTDDKSLTYLAVLQSAELLEKFNVAPICFWRAYDESKLKDTILKALDEAPEIIIKPHGGSGGSGIDIVTDKKQIDSKVLSSLTHYQEKFGKDRNPFPYTVCERVDSSPALWRSDYHQFDIRVYVGRNGNNIIPLGALCRIAIEPFTVLFNKKSFVVNLSGYGGVDTSRGLGISLKTLQILNLDFDDFVNIFASACALMSSIAEENYFRLKQEVYLQETFKT